MMKIKIGIQNAQLPTQIGGAERAIHSQVKALSEDEDFETHLIVPKVNDYDKSFLFKDIESMNVKIHEVDISDLKIEGESDMKNCDLWHLQSARLGIKASQTHSDNDDFDLLVAHYSTDLLFFPEDSIRVYHIHGVPSKFQPINDNALNNADYLLSHTIQNAKDWKKMHGITDKNIGVIHLGIDTSKYRDLNLDRDNDIIFVGRLIQNKGVENLLEAISYYDKNLKCKIIGDGPMKNRLEKRITELNLVNTRILNGLDDEDVVKAYNQSKVAVYPSTSKEGIILAMLEAASCGCAIITSNCCGMPEFTGEKSEYGTLVEPFDTESLSSEIKKLIENDDYREERSIKARERIRTNFENDNSNENIKQYYKSITSGKIDISR